MVKVKSTPNHFSAAKQQRCIFDFKYSNFRLAFVFGNIFFPQCLPIIF